MHEREVVAWFKPAAVTEHQEKYLIIFKLTVFDLEIMEN